MEIGEDAALRRHAVEVGRFVSRRAERADIGVAHVVDEDDDDIGRALGRLLLRFACAAISAESVIEKNPKSTTSCGPRRIVGWLYMAVARELEGQFGSTDNIGRPFGPDETILAFRVPRL